MLAVICTTLALGLVSSASAQACAKNGGISAPAGTECVWQADALFNGTLVKAGSSNIQTSALACCDSCKNTSSTATGEMPCNTWTWCGNSAGCCPLRGGCTSSSKLVAYQQCTLLFDEALEYADESPKPTYVYNATDVGLWTSSELANTSAMTSGVYLPTLVEPEQISGYSYLTGQDVTGDDYLCPGSDFIGVDVGGCRLNGTLSELAAGCSADPKCSAFTYQPYGCCSSRTSNNLYESGWRKTGSIEPQCTTFLPHTNIYVKGTASS